MSPHPLELPIVEVTVFEDRAHIVREGPIHFEGGQSRYALASITPVLADRSLQGSLHAEVEARLGAVRIARRLETSSDDEARIRLEDALEELDADLAERGHTLSLIRAEQVALIEIDRLLVQELSEDAAADRWDVEPARRSLEAIGERLVSSARARAALELELEARGADRAHLERRLVACKRARSERRASLELLLEAEAAGEGRLRVEYVVPGACWRPQHRARWMAGRLEWSTYACVWQSTLEDWRDVRLRLSTERPSLGASPPELESDVLRARPKREIVRVAARDQTIHTTGLGAGKRVSELPGIDDGGEVLTLEPSEGRASIPADGRPFRVPILEMQIEARLERIVRAELAPLVFLRSEQVNEGARPILAGPVELLGESGPMGRTSVLFIAPGEHFELGWGPDSALRVHRQQERLDEERTALSSWTRVPHRVRLRLSNLGMIPRKIRVEERIPVSEIEEVEVHLDAKLTRPGYEPDGDGILRWVLELGPRDHQELRLAYELRRKGNVQGL